MRVKGLPVRIGDLARAFAACHPVTVNGVSTSPVLLRGYLENLEHCVGANDCAFCRRELERLAAAMGTTCAECGAARFRRLCRDVGPCDRR
jgi:DNA-directed RNA polymerase subunit RPC12/RpoP